MMRTCAKTIMKCGCLNSHSGRFQNERRDRIGLASTHLILAAANLSTLCRRCIAMEHAAIAGMTIDNAVSLKILPANSTDNTEAVVARVAMAKSVGKGAYASCARPKKSSARASRVNRNALCLFAVATAPFPAVSCQAVQSPTVPVANGRYNSAPLLPNNHGEAVLRATSAAARAFCVCPRCLRLLSICNASAFRSRKIVVKSLRNPSSDGALSASAPRLDKMLVTRTLRDRVPGLDSP